MKKYRVKINAFAESDLEIASDWYASQKEGLDKDFIEEIGKAIQRIQENPHQFAVLRMQFRMSVVKRFPYGIYFLITDDIIHVFAVFHFSRNPKALQKRLKPKIKKK
ncbi:MAG: type II toxin-antitoxin system RelE/ParE family toxin [Bacteroidia bacterium]